MKDFERFEKLIQNGVACISIVSFEENYAIELARAAAMKLGRDFWIWSAADGVRDGMLEGSPAVAGTDKPSAGLDNLSQAEDGAICVTLDLAANLKDGRTLRALRNIIEAFDKIDATLVMIDAEDRMPEVIKSYAKTFEISYPDEKELKDIIKATLLRIHRKKPVEIGITHRGLDTIVRNLRGLTRRQAEMIISEAIARDQKFADHDINAIIASKRRLLQRSGLLEYIKTPLDLSEIGGMKRLKEWLGQRKDAFTSEAEKFGITAPRGVLMLGVQGAGKSLCAKAIATAWHQPLLKLDPSSLYASYIGESERNLREALKQTEMMSPVVLWIDEIEKAFASAAARSADGGLSQRMFGTLLTWLQEREAPVFVVATANDIEALPPELLRKGRFDEIFFLNLPDEEVREEIFAIHIQKRNREPGNFDLNELSKESKGYSGAEIEQAVVSALHEAYSKKEELATEGIISALQNSPPLSITMAERVEALLEWAKGRCVPAD
ncbi:MAG: AAA family ATPase [Sedimentisphaerales bacterium]|nr:AAA family ATPase [Sedimentisphaerales bacterium]